MISRRLDKTDAFYAHLCLFMDEKQAGYLTGIRKIKNSIVIVFNWILYCLLMENCIHTNE